MLIFLITFIVYLVTLFPSCAPYRDTGEMISMAHTLGVAHPPGYPFYTLLSKAALIFIHFGNEAYRLNVLSALAGALTAYFMYRVFLLINNNKLLAGAAALLFSFSYLQWYLSLVSEMYTINTLFAAAILYLAFKLDRETFNLKTLSLKLLYLVFFLFGLGLGNRMDLLMLGAGLLWVLFINRKFLTLSSFFTAVICFAAGFTVFLYLPIRSSHLPLLDWNHPASLEKLWGSLSRKTHGGTLDLISTGYASGENFPATIKFYFSHIFSGFAYIGLPLGLLGLYRLYKQNLNMAVATFLAWLLAGPLFIYLANMPPNTHALVILEAHFLFPNLIFFIWVYAGLAQLAEKRKLPVAALCAAFAVFNLYQNLPELNKRVNFIAYDFAKNILRSAPPDSIVVMKKDVQLFALWNMQYVEHSRPDLAIVPQGLSNSEWFKKPWVKLHPGTAIGLLESSYDWQLFMEANRGKSVYFSGDAAYNKPAGYTEASTGLLNRVITGSPNPSDGVLLDYIYPYRGEYLYTAYKEFFTPDLIEDYARANMWTGMSYIGGKQYKNARKYLYKAVSLKPMIPQAWSYIAYTYFDEGDKLSAKTAYSETVKQYAAYLELARQFNTTEEMYQNFSREYSDALIAYGVTLNDLGETQPALNEYGRAIEVYPNNPRAYYNRSVLYWKLGQWDRVVADLENTVRLEPSFTQAAAYLQNARMKLAQQSKY